MGRGGGVSNTIAWFRRDLRVADNHVLVDAVAAAREADGAVIPLFVLDPALWDRSGPNRAWFLAGCLEELDGALDGGLVVRHGDPAEVIPELCRQHDVGRVFRAQDVGVYGRRRDEAVETALAADDVEVVEADSPYAVPAGTLRTGAGGAFKVYSAYLRAWRQQRLAATTRRPSDVPTVARVRSDGVPKAPAVTAELPRARRGGGPPGARSVRPHERRRLRRRAERSRRRLDQPAVGVPQVRVPPPPPGDPQARRAQPVTRHVRQGAGVARLLRRRAARVARFGVVVVGRAHGDDEGRRGQAIGRAIRGVAGRVHGLPDRRRRDAPAGRRRVDAQPGADDHGQLPRQGPPRRLDTWSALVHGAARRR